MYSDRIFAVNKFGGKVGRRQSHPGIMESWLRSPSGSCKLFSISPLSAATHTWGPFVTGAHCPSWRATPVLPGEGSVLLPSILGPPLDLPGSSWEPLLTRQLRLETFLVPLFAPQAPDWKNTYLQGWC